jgi:hypothetical protein
MATTVAPPPVVVEPEVTVVTPPAKVKVVKKTTSKKVSKKDLKKASKKAAEKGRSWVKRAARKTKKVTKKGWGKLRASYRWVVAKAKKAANVTRDKAKAAAVWTKANASKGWTWTKVHATRSRIWLRQAAIGAWEYMAPFRNWISTPFRLALGTTTGLAALLTFGGQVIVLLALPWIAYLLWSGKLTFNQKGRKSVKKAKAKKAKAKKAERKAAKREAETAALLDEVVEGRVLNEAQSNALEHRMIEVDEQGTKWADQENKNMSSEYAGRSYLLHQRMMGSIKTVNALAREHRVLEESAMGTETARETYTWTAVKRGMRDEDKIVQVLLAQHEGDLVPQS